MEKIVGNERSRCFACILYEDSTQYDLKHILEYVSNHIEKYAYIKHEPEEEDNKIHYHLLMYFPNKRWKSSLSSELGVPINYFQKAQLVPYLKYLIHFDNEEKIQYKVDDVKGTLKEKLNDVLNFNSEQNQFSEILVYFETTLKIITWTDLTYFCLNHNLYACYRRNVNSLKMLLSEHNEEMRKRGYFQ